MTGSGPQFLKHNEFSKSWASYHQNILQIKGLERKPFWQVKSLLKAAKQKCSNLYLIYLCMYKDTSKMYV